MSRFQVRVPIIMEVIMEVEATNQQQAISIAIDNVGIRKVVPNKSDTETGVKSVAIGELVAYENTKYGFLTEAEAVEIQENIS